MMPYAVVIQTDFACPRTRVYAALCDLGNYPAWNAGMTEISTTEPMHEGLRYQTAVEVLGRVNRATITVIRMVPNQEIHLESTDGIIAYRALFQLADQPHGHCRLTCILHFRFSAVVFNLAQPVVKAVAEAYISGNIETLKQQLEE